MQMSDWRWLATLVLSVLSSTVCAQACYRATIVAPTPFMGNNDEVFKLSDGSLWKVTYEYEYLYEYNPEVTICPGRGRLLVANKSLAVVAMIRPRVAPSTGSTAGPERRQQASGITVVAHQSGCQDYFVASGPKGFYLLEWYGGHDPSVGDVLVGDIDGYGFKDVFYEPNGLTGRVYVDDYQLSKSSVIEKYTEKCR